MRPQAVDGYCMGECVRGGSINKRLSQLKHFWKKCPFSVKKGFSGFVFLFLGVGVFPALPMIDTKELTGGSETPENALVVNPEELCRWQKDFSFFNELVHDKKISGKEVLCSEEVSAENAIAVATPAKQDENLSTLIRDMATGYPLEVMAPAIAEYDRSVAALIVGIAKKESNWGKRVPVDALGADCFNYWGFKGAGSRGVAMGHGCFGSPEEAVHAVGNRIAELVEIRKTSEPKNMIIWKCGSSCATHSPESVRKWIADVDMYYRKIVIE